MSCSLPDTQTPDFLSLTPGIASEMVEVRSVWGRLYPKILFLEPADLDKPKFLLGRAEECDVIITDKKIPLNRLLTISKLHFLITKEAGFPIYITDKSKNGTYLNGVLIGKGKQNILQNDDEISVGLPNLKIYVFKTIQAEQNVYLPSELRNKYETSRLLGKGSCGEVKLAFAKSTCRPYAIKKIIKGKLGSGKDNLLNHPNQIKNEVNILKSLSHPCVIGLEEIVETEDAVFIVLEYMEGGELTDRVLSINRLSEENVKLYFYQIVLAVQYLHGQGITHRDLKPENVLLKSDETETIVKVSDFGLSKIVNEETMMRTVCGTPNYVAPEVLDQKVTCYGEEVDVWSLGVILFQMLSQELPFKSKERAILNKCILTGSYAMSSDAWSSISKEAKNLVKRMLTVNPEERISIEQILNDPWIYDDYNVEMKVAKIMANCCDSDSISEDSSCEIPQKRMKIHHDVTQVGRFTN